MENKTDDEYLVFINIEIKNNPSSHKLKIERIHTIKKLGVLYVNIYSCDFKDWKITYPTLV